METNVVLVLICGARDWKTDGRIKVVISKLEWYALCIGTELRVLVGGASGADQIAKHICDRIGIEVVEMRAQWSEYGKSAGPIRNRAMLDQKPDLVIAFHPVLPNSKGTKDCVEEARRRGIPTYVLRELDDDGYKYLFDVLNSKE